jgi:hypothetical protein
LIFTCEEQFKDLLKAYVEQNILIIPDEDITMYCFQGIHSARNAGFKTEVMNLLTMKSLLQPTSLSEMFQNGSS